MQLHKQKSAFFIKILLYLFHIQKMSAFFVLFLTQDVLVFR